MTVLIIAEHDSNALNPATWNAAAAAAKLGDDIHVLIAGHNAKAAADEATTIQGVTKVLHSEDAAFEHHLAENIAPLIAKIGKDYTHIIAPATFFGKNVLPRAAALLDVQQISDVTAIQSADTFVRPVYAGNALATVKSSDTPKVLTIRPTGFDKAPAGGSGSVETLESTGDAGLSSWVKEELTKSDRPELAGADIVISGGRGMGSGEAFEMLEKVADKLGAAIGASRAAVDAGYVPNDYQVGQTGKVVAPNLYIAVGISGAIQHLAGMKDSKVIVAINKDEDAPIFQVADYGLVADLFKVLPELEEKL